MKKFVISKVRYIKRFIDFFIAKENRLKFDISRARIIVVRIMELLL